MSTMTRRSFCKGGLFAAVGLALASIQNGATAELEEKLRVSNAVRDAQGSVMESQYQHMVSLEESREGWYHVSLRLSDTLMQVAQERDQLRHRVYELEHGVDPTLQWES